MLADSEGRTPMHWAVDRGHLKIAEALLSRNADVNAKVIIVSLLRFYWYSPLNLFVCSETIHV